MRSVIAPMLQLTLDLTTCYAAIDRQSSFTSTRSRLRAKVQCHAICDAGGTYRKRLFEQPTVGRTQFPISGRLAFISTLSQSFLHKILNELIEIGLYRDRLPRDNNHHSDVRLRCSHRYSLLANQGWRTKGDCWGLSKCLILQA